jgi:hypothetical protein
MMNIFDTFRKAKVSDGLASLDDIKLSEVNIVWPESWWFLENETDEAKLRISIQQELNSEIGPKHPLWGYMPVVFAKSEKSDDVLVYLNDGRFAVVHLVWYGHIDQVPYKFPRTVFLEDKNELQRFLNEEM